MMEAAEVDNLDRYKSYIQRRRVVTDTTEDNILSPSEIGKSEPLTDYGYSTMDYNNNTRKEAKTESERKSPLENLLREDFMGTANSATSAAGVTSTTDSYRADDSIHSHYSPPTPAIRRTDISPYRRLYGQNKNTNTSPYANARYGYGSSSHAEIEDNRATVLAVKIIKQALTCFAVLGLIVLLQQRSDTGQVLAFIKKQVVDTHIEPQSLLTGVENIWKVCSRFLGGSP